ncbi:MAG: hypothetical protein HY721_35510 [Planctomycetes bacterium]|nr:hypothetical protein [Planctomycetota bacterium]
MISPRYDLINRAIRETQAAFSGLKPPGWKNLFRNPQGGDDSDVEEFYAYEHTDWRDLPPDLIERNYDALCFFGPEALRFYLPAFMVWTLRNFLKSNSFTVDSTIYCLNQVAKGGSKSGLSRYSLFTPEQRHATRTFLEVMSQYPEHVDAEAARKALERYWRGCAP